ncbi:MAG: PilX N-terminal domain-containing pilus assembly protein [Desulfobulbaceae bacterium]|nr:PilX N-terminal domain-containing pilus assembly protein [Desulfobulbaceae bacterium]
MCKKESILSNERGFVLVASMLILLILLVIGIAATTTSTIDMQIANNEKVHQQTFYQADGGAELGSRVTYENALCINSGGFAEDPAGTGKRIIGKVEVLNLTFASPGGGVAPLPSDGVRDVVFYPGNASDDDSHTNMTIVGRTVATSGSGLAMVAGYEGLGSSSAAGGTHVLYTINSQHRGLGNSESVVGLEWKLSGHLINNASSADCKFD